MSDTPKTPIQLPQDNDSLLRHLVVLVETLTQTVDEIKVDIKSLDTRISVLETSRDTVGKLDNLVASVAEFGQELKDTKAEFHQELKGIKQQQTEFSQQLADIKEQQASQYKETREYLRKIERNTHKINSELAETILRVDELEDVCSKKI